MVIVSNTRVNGRREKQMSYDEFRERAFSEQGLDLDDSLMINIHDMNQEEYEAASGEDAIGFFSLTGTCPAWTDAQKVQDWSQFVNMPQEQQVAAAAAPAPSMQMPDQSVFDGVVTQDSSAIPDSMSEMGRKVQEVKNLLDDSGAAESGRGARVYVFGSSKGGTGKTFTAIISTYRYANTHPHQKIALVDFDIIDGQVGISIHKVQPTIRKYFSEYQKGRRDFQMMSSFAVKAKPPFPQNVDFYLAPSNNARINDDNFWINVIQNCIENYDVVVFDTGIDYINLRPISYVYKCADKILLITTTSIKSVNSVTKQVARLKGEIPSKDERGNNVFSAEDDIAPHLHIVITQMVPNNQQMNKTIYNSLAERANVIATFGVITDSVSRAEFFYEWDVFDHNTGVNKALDDIMS